MKDFFREYFLSNGFFLSLCIVAYETFGILLFIGVFFKTRENWRKRGRLLLIFSMIIGTTYIAHYFSAYNVQKGICLILFNTVIMTVYYKINAVQAIFIYLVPYGINLSIDIIFLFLLEHFWPDKYLTLMSKSISAFFFSLLCKTVFFLVTIGLGIFWNREENLNILNKREWGLFFYFPVFTFIACWLFVLKAEWIDTYAPEFYVIPFGLIFINMIAFYLMKYIAGKETDIRNRELMNQKHKLQMLSYQTLNREYDKQRKFIHDYKNQLNCIYGMLKNGELKEVVNYIDSLTGGLETDIHLVHTGNSAADAVINQKYGLAKSCGIPVIFSINDLSLLPMREEDIVSLLSNLFDNAIEACEKLKGNKQICCKLIMDQGQFIVSMHNPIENKIRIKNGRISTDKNNKNEHGIGLMSMESIISKYGGSYSITAENGEYCFSAVISFA